MLKTIFFVFLTANILLFVSCQETTEEFVGEDESSSFESLVQSSEQSSAQSSEQFSEQSSEQFSEQSSSVQSSSEQSSSVQSSSEQSSSVQSSSEQSSSEQSSVQSSGQSSEQTSDQSSNSPSTITRLCRKDNEEYSNCVNRGCYPTSCSQLGKPTNCDQKLDPKDCIGGCTCKSGFLRADNGACIPRSDCPSCNGDPNAESGCGTFCHRCSNFNTSYVCAPGCIFNGCQCKKGFIYDDNTKKCVLPKQCTPTCKKNEVYSACTNTICAPKTCSELGKPLNCGNVDPKDCIKGCICKAGFVRDEDGTCVPIENCPSCNGDPNAESGCGNFCDRCSNYNTSHVCALGCILNGCQCKKGFIYDDNTKKCVLPEQCTPTCKKDEVYSACTNTICAPKTCSELGKPLNCGNVDPKDCIKGCICKAGFVRDEDGKCIPRENCPSCNGDPNAESGCGNFCDRCSNYNTSHVCALGCILNGCQCKKGFIYDDNTKKCVLPEQCTPTCKKDEVYSACTNTICAPKTCSELGKPLNCGNVDPKDCIKGCICKAGFVRDEDGTCIPRENCPSCNGDPNAEAGCGTFCHRCSNYNTTYKCGIGCILNGCQCKKGFIYDDNTKKCVLPEQCTPTCKKDEVYSDCTNKGCFARSCSQLGKPLKCDKVEAKDCVKGCMCKTGFIRAEDGSCIPTENCPSCNGDPNAESGCGTFCHRCSNYNTTYKCGIGCILNGCQCRKGFIYDDNTKKCVLPEQCTPTCKKDEVYSDCTNKGCFARSCSQLGKPLKCDKVEAKDCVKGCMCKTGFIRAEDGSCIPTENCPSCNGDPNAESGCGTFCDRCSNYNTSYVCPLGCILNGCQCKKGFIYDGNTKKCVLPEQCTPTCKSNEEYSTCASGLCRYQICTQYGLPPPNCDIPGFNLACEGGCVCKVGFLRNANGNCVPQDECLAPTCKTNEEYSTCANGLCRLQSCTQYGQPMPFCPRFDTSKCKVGCVCKIKFLRNKQGKCVPQDECPEAKPTTTTELPYCDEGDNDD